MTVVPCVTAVFVHQGDVTESSWLNRRRVDISPFLVGEGKECRCVGSRGSRIGRVAKTLVGIASGTQAAC